MKIVIKVHDDTSFSYKFKIGPGRVARLVYIICPRVPDKDI
jgi:hypothetical protein